MANFKNKLLSKSNQYNFYKENYNALLEENKILKESLPDKNIYKLELRGSSVDSGKIIFLDWLFKNVKKNERILDVGFGSGVYGKLMKAFYYENIDGVDVWSRDIEKMGLNYIYDNIYIENVLDFEFDHYDLIIMGDVLEHIPLKESKELLNKFNCLFKFHICMKIIMHGMIIPMKFMNKMKLIKNIWKKNFHF